MSTIPSLADTIVDAICDLDLGLAEHDVALNAAAVWEALADRALRHGAEILATAQSDESTPR